MKFNIRIISLLLFTLLVFNTNAQELNCSVQVNSSQVQGSDKSIFDVMQKNIFEFMNNRKWTNNVFINEERIECSILITVTEQISVSDFKGTIQIQSRRPIFNTSYNSTTLNHIDRDFDFKFNEFDNLEYSETTFISNLTSVLSYYAYVILALDYDSFSLKGGTPYLQKAQLIVSNAQGAREPGWKAFESTKNRYWFVENLSQPNFAPMRECWYQYHRLGFDNMAKNVTGGRAQVLKSLLLLEKVNSVTPNSNQMQIFFNTKSDEIINLFKDALPKEKAEVTNLLTKVNPINASKYASITSGRK